MDLSASVVIGFFLGFAFGVGCALAVMYSIYMGGYRAAIADLQKQPIPERLRNALSRSKFNPESLASSQNADAREAQADKFAS